MKTKIFFLNFILLAFGNALSSQTFQWANKIGGTSSDLANEIAIDDSGNVYTTGYFQGTADFNPGSGTFNLSSVGGLDIFISKLDASGNFVWAKSLGGSSSDQATSITVDKAGNVYTVGSFQGTADFNPGSGTFNLTSAGMDDIFISKLDASGNFVWAKSIGSTSIDRGLSIAIDTSGNFYTTGSFWGTVDFDPGSGSLNLSSAGSSDIFITKFDTAGNFIWAKSLGGASDELGSSISLDIFGNLYTTGYFQGTADFNPSSSTFNLTSSGGLDAFICKLDTAGNFVWAKKMGGTGTVLGSSLTADNTGNIYATGHFRATADFDPGSGIFNLTSLGTDDIYITKLDSHGDFVWAKSLGNTTRDRGISITNDAFGNIYTTGYFQGIVDFDPGIGTFNLSSVGSFDVFVLKLDAAGNFVKAVSYGGSNADQARSIAVDDRGNGYTTGYFQGTADFDPSSSTLNLISAGQLDVYIHKINLCTANSGTDTQTACNSFTWINGETYTSSNNTAKDTLVNMEGCDSIVTLNLTMNYSTSGIDVQTACNSFTWINGETYTSSNNTAKDTLKNAAGCDSIITLNLTINNSTSSTDVQTACNSFTWINGKTYTSSNNTAKDTIKNAEGCDSIITLNLTINNSTFSTDVQTACNSFTWINGETYTSSNNTAKDTLKNAAGCDSIITLDLTINSVSDITTTLNGNTIQANNNNATYVWLDCDQNFGILSGQTNQSFTATADGNYAVELIENGCVDTSVCVALKIVGVIENEIVSNWLVYPNPIAGSFMVDMGKTFSTISVSIANSNGQIIKSRTFNDAQLLNLNITEPAGLYLLTIDVGVGRAVMKLIKN